MKEKIDIESFEQEAGSKLKQVLQGITDTEILRDLFLFFKDYRSHFVQRKSSYDSRLAALQSLVTLVLTSGAAVIVFLFQQKEIIFGFFVWVLGSLYLTGLLASVVIFVMVIIDLMPRSEFRELNEPDLVQASLVKHQGNFYRKQILTLVLQSASNSLRIERRYRYLQNLFRVFLGAFLGLIFGGVGLYILLPDKKNPDFTVSPAKIQIVDEPSYRAQLDDIRRELKSLRAQVQRGRK